MWCLDDPKQSPLYCIPKVITQDDNLYARVLKQVVIEAQSFAPIEVGTRNFIPPKEWRSQVLCTCTDNLWTEFGATVLQGIADFTKGPATLCIINTTSQDLILKSGHIVAKLAPIQLQESNTYPILGSKTGGSCDVNQLHSLFQESFDGSKRIDNDLPLSLFNIVPSDRSRGFTFKEHDELINLFKLKADYTLETDDMSEFEDDVDIISCPLATPRSRPLGKGESPEAIEKLLAKCNDTLSEDQMKVAREKIASMTDTFMDSSVPLVDTNAVAHYIDTGSTRPIRILLRRVAPGRKVIIEEEVTKMLQAGVIHASDSPCSSPIVLVKKKDGMIRFCIDYRSLNDVTRKNSYLLPRIDDNLEALKGKKWFCTLDLASSYSKIKMSDMDVEKTAFACHVGLYKFLKMTYGLTNAPATFQCLMEKS